MSAEQLAYPWTKRNETPKQFHNRREDALLFFAGSVRGILDGVEKKTMTPKRALEAILRERKKLEAEMDWGGQ